MRIYKLSNQFYEKYGDNEEILQKNNRPYYCLTINIDNTLYAIPFRHNISHRYSFITIDKGGLDFSKAVVISNNSYLGSIAQIDSSEFNIVKRNEGRIKIEFKKYIRLLNKAIKNPSIPRHENILKYSALKYFIENK